MLVRPSEESRFRQYYRVDKVTECWEWQLSRSRNGYGRFKVGGVVERAHRVSYHLHKGPIPEGMLVCHECDNPGCVNPEHLFLGTPKCNMQDMVSKGRQRWLSRGGEENPRAVLTEKQAEEVIKLIAAGLDNKSIAQRFGVTHSSISNIRRGKTWKKLRRPDDHPAFEPYGSIRAADRAVF